MCAGALVPMTLCRALADERIDMQLARVYMNRHLGICLFFSCHVSVLVRILLRAAGQRLASGETAVFYIYIYIYISIHSSAAVVCHKLLVICSLCSVFC